MSDPKNSQSTMTSSEDANLRFQETKDLDPFPEIPPALLNSADIHDYIEKTGMVYPYDPKLLKSSSYEAQIGNEAIFWDEKGYHLVKFDNKRRVELKPNSLVFFRTKQEFRLPSYMAIRFNLRITNVHRGLLLGTGPLVDPGFEGRLLIPIHNLTNNSYYFKGGDPFIWVEFTKISPNKIWNENTSRADTQNGKYEPFRDSKKWLEPYQYFLKANDGGPIQNAIPAALEETKRNAESANSTVGKIAWGGIAAAIVAAIGFYPLITNSLSLSNEISTTISEFQSKYRNHLLSDASFETKIDTLATGYSKLEILSSRLTELDAIVASIQSNSDRSEQIDLLKTQVEQLKKQIDHLAKQIK